MHLPASVLLAQAFNRAIPGLRARSKKDPFRTPMDMRYQAAIRRILNAERLEKFKARQERKKAKAAK